MEAQERVLGADHPETLLTVYNLGVCLTTKGDFTGAAAYCERALESRERVVGPDHRDTLLSMRAVADLHLAKGDLVSAEVLILIKKNSRGPSMRAG